MKKSVLTGVLAAMGCETIYGFSYLFTKAATGKASAFALLGWRFGVAFLVLGLCAAIGLVKINFRGKNLKPLLAIAVLNPAIYFTGETLGINFTTASESGVMIASIPVVSLAAAALILRDRPTKWQVIGILVTLVGAVLTVVTVSQSPSFSIVGYAFLLMAIASFSLYSVAVQKAKVFTSAELTFAMLGSGAVVFGGVALVEAVVKGSVSELVRLPFLYPEFLSAVGYLGLVSSILAFFLMNYALSTIGVNRTSSFIGISTVVAVVAGMLILGEPFTMGQIVGSVFILLGVYVANVRLETASSST